MILVLSLAATLALPPARTDTAVFAGGCFWGVEAVFEHTKGVRDVVSGYAGGKVANPTYQLVSTDETGHAESVQVIYDPAKISYVQLLEIFWHNVDPFAENAQFCDRGTQYRSAIFYQGDEQRRAAWASKARLEEQPRFKGKIATQLVAASVFYPAEEYHQDYYKKNPVHYQAYRLGCGRDKRLKEIWGAAGGHP